MGVGIRQLCFPRQNEGKKKTVWEKKVREGAVGLCGEE